MAGDEGHRTSRKTPAPIALPVAAAIGLAAVGSVLAGCGRPPVATARLTPVDSGCIARPSDACAIYSYAKPAGNSVVVSAPDSASGNEREFFWAHRGPTGAAETACATFSSGNDLDQQGIVLRLVLLSDGRVEAVSVTRNVWMRAFNVFNFHLWDTREPAPDNFRQFGSVVVPSLPVTPVTYPLDMCARTDPATDTVQFVVWTPGQPQPAWGDPAHGGQATLPPEAPASGRSGWFAGHLSAGTSMRYADLTVDGSVPTGLS